MRRAFDLLQRLLLTLALIVAAMPVKASAPGCAPVRPTCAMPCCAAKAVERMACAAPEHAIKASCPCDLRPGPTVALVPAKAAPPTFEGPAVASGTPSVPPAANLAWAEPGVFGADSGPPPKPPHRSDASRAPPVVRA